MDAERGDSACPDNSANREHRSRYPRSGFEPASARSSLEEKTVNCGEPKTDGHGGDKVWPVYDQYVTELIAINDKKFGLIQEYADNWVKFTN